MKEQEMAVKVTQSTESVLGVLHKGRATPGHIVEETDLARQTVHSQLNQLLAGEHIRYVHEATGLYELVDDPRDDVNAGEADADDIRDAVREAREAYEDVDGNGVDDAIARLEDLTGVTDEHD